MKQKLLLLFAGATLFLTSCAPLDKALEGQLLKFSHVKEESDYQQYAQLLEQGKLDEDGRFTAESSTESPPEGSVYVTFGRNAYLDASYYSDENLTHLLSEEGCFLFPGDSIYAGEAIIKNPNSNLYTLKNYRVTVFYETGLSEEITVSKDGTNPLVFTIPEDFTGTGLSIYPIGFYQDRTLDLSVYCMDEETRISLASAGQWYINDTACSGNSASISATEAYTLRLDYDTEEYFFVSSTPQCFTQNPNADGRVEFWEAASTDEDCLYEVELHHYLSLTLQCDDAATITVNDEEPVKLSKNKSFTRDDLKFGDILIIDTTGTCSIKEGDYRYVAASKDPLTNGNRYRLTIVSQPQDAAAEELTKVMPVTRTFQLNLLPEGTYGESVYEINGTTVNGTVEADEGDTLTITYTLTNDLYAFKAENKGIIGFFSNFFHKNVKTITIPITADMNGSVIQGETYVELVKKEDA